MRALCVIAVEREHKIGLDVGVPLLVVQQSSSTVLSGTSFGLHYSYGLNDAFNLLADGSTSLLFAGTPSMVTMNNVNVGLGYVLDVLSWVPWAGIELGGYAVTADPAGGTQIYPGASLSLGVDYRFDRSWAAGIVLRQHMLLSHGIERDATLPSFTQGFARIEYTWGW
jgi:hypothetical protein